MAEFVRCKRCRLTLISNQELECVTTCHGNTNVAEDHPCYLDKSVIYIKEEEMPNWIENLVQLVSISSFEILKPLCFINSFFFRRIGLKGKLSVLQHPVLLDWDLLTSVLVKNASVSNLSFLQSALFQVKLTN